MKQARLSAAAGAPEVSGRRGVASREALARENASLAARVDALTAQLRAVDEEREAFDYALGHDLRAPLRGLDGFSRALLEFYGDQLDGEARDLLQHIRGETQRLAGLIADLLKLAHVSRAQMQVTALDLGEIAAAIAADLRAADPARQVEIAIAADLRADGDPGLVSLALRHLLDNAWKFTRTRARAHIDVGRAADPRRRVFFVRDDGVGFDRARATRLFGPFQRFHRAVDYEGSGIGLAVVRRVVQRHGGAVWAEATDGHGATFYFTLSPEP